MKILMVEDNQDFLDTAVRHLKKHEVVGVTNLLDGLNEIRENKFDLLISDWYLNRDLSETSDEIIEFALEKGIRTIIETSNPDHSDLDKYRDKTDIVDKFEFWDRINGLIEGSKRRSKEV